MYFCDSSALKFEKLKVSKALSLDRHFELNKNIKTLSHTLPNNLERLILYTT